MSLLLATGSGPQPPNNLAIFYAARFAARLVISDDSFISITTYDAYSTTNTVGQPWSLTYWKSSRQQQDSEDYSVRSPAPFPWQIAPTGATATTPWFLWQASYRGGIDETYEVKSGKPDLHLYRQPTQTVGQGTWPLYWTSTRQQQDAEGYEVRSAKPDLHLFRTGFQTVGQTWNLLYWTSQRQAVADDSFVSITTFDAYSTTNTVGQPWSLINWKTTRQAVEAEPYEVRTPAPFPRQIVVSAPTASTPWFLWKPATSFSEDEWPYQRFNHSQLFQYIQPWVSFAFYGTNVLDLNEDVWQDAWRLPKSVDLLPFRQITPATGGSTPWNLLWWKTSQQQQDAEGYEVRAPAPTVHRFRTTYQTVGQPWQQLYWKSKTQQQGPEEYEVRTPFQANLYFHTTAKVVGAPWLQLFWKSNVQVVADDSFTVGTSYTVYSTTTVSAGTPSTLLQTHPIGLSFMKLGGTYPL